MEFVMPPAPTYQHLPATHFNIFFSLKILSSKPRKKIPFSVPFRASHLGLSASKSKLGPKPTPAGQVLGNVQSDDVINHPNISRQ